MAWSTPPTFADGDVLSATDLNVLADDLEYLKGVLDGSNIVHMMRTTTIDATWQYYIRHTHDYCHYYIKQTVGDSDEISIKYYDSGGSLVATVLTDATNRSATYTWQGSGDVSALTVGTYYRVDVAIALTGTSSNTTYYVFEAPNA